MSLDYNSLVRQSSVKNYLYDLRFNTLIVKGTKVLKALFCMYKIKLKLSLLCPILNSKDTSKNVFKMIRVCIQMGTRAVVRSCISSADISATVWLAGTRSLDISEGKAGEDLITSNNDGTTYQ